MSRCHQFVRLVCNPDQCISHHRDHQFVTHVNQGQFVIHVNRGQFATLVSRSTGRRHHHHPRLRLRRDHVVNNHSKLINLQSPNYFTFSFITAQELNGETIECLVQPQTVIRMDEWRRSLLPLSRVFQLIYIHLNNQE